MDEIPKLEELKARLEARVERLTRRLEEAKREHDAVVTSLKLLELGPIDDDETNDG